MAYITKGIGGFYYVKTPDGVVECKARGIFRKRGITPVAGDNVTLSDDGTMIDEILPRKNVFIRPPIANLDILFIVTSTTQPVPSTLVLDQLAAAAIYKDLQPVLAQEPTGKTVAFFYITTAGAVNVRKSGDYIAKAIRMAGGDYVSFDESGEENALSTMTIQMESFYDAAADADVLIYNSTIDGELDSLDALLAKSPLLADFKAVQTGNVWCITKNFYQESLALGDLILDVHAVLNDKDAGDLRFLRKLS